MNEGQDRPLPSDLWPAFDAMNGLPAMVIRGVLSDILASETVAEMQSSKPDLVVAEIPGRGLTPILDEPACIAAIDSFLEGQ